MVVLMVEEVEVMVVTVLVLSPSYRDAWTHLKIFFCGKFMREPVPVNQSTAHELL